jgi:hypothetical protein
MLANSPNNRYNSYIEVMYMGYRGEQVIKGKIYVYDAVAIWDPVKTF